MSVELNIEVDPAWSHRLLAAVTIVMLVLIWGAYIASNNAIRNNLERALVKDTQELAVVLEDHASRTMDAVSARLEFVTSITSGGKIWSDRLSPDYLRSLTSETPMLRSLSLVDETGHVLASSARNNLGLVLPLDKLPPDGALGIPTFGGLYPVRDLHELLDEVVRTDVDLWLAAVSVEVAGSRLRWIAGVNPGYFYNFWNRANITEDYQISLFDYSGRHIMGFNSIKANELALEESLADALLKRDLGLIELGVKARWKVAYRGSRAHPFVFAVIGDRERAFASQADEERRRLIAALLASLAVLVIMLVIYRGHRRYEASVTEMLNQSRAISAHLMVSEADHEGKIISANARFLARTGYSEAEIIGKNHKIFNTGLYDNGFSTKIWNTVKDGAIWKGIFRNRDASGAHYWVDATIVPFANLWGGVNRFVCFYSDITEAVELSKELQVERDLRKNLSTLNHSLLTEATTDELTGLSNRRGFSEFCDDAIKNAREFDQTISTLMMDLDNFKNINDSYGHSAGDQVLREMAQRWAEQIRSSDHLARLGGEEFCIILPNTPSSHAVTIAENLCETTRDKPVIVTSNNRQIELSITVSIGVASNEQVEVTEIERMLTFADEALYEAKRTGRDRVSIAE